MVLIDNKFDTFEQYVESLSRKARKNYAYVKKHNADLVFMEMPYHRQLVESFMQMWERQLVRGKPIQWAFPIGYVEELALKGKLKFFVVMKGKEPIAMMFIQRRIGFWEAHSIMWDKTEENEKRYLAKRVWFFLIEYVINNKLGILNMGGGLDHSWREMLSRRHEFPNPSYKFIFVPEEAKERPESQPDYAIEEIHGDKILYKK